MIEVKSLLPPGHLRPRQRDETQNSRGVSKSTECLQIRANFENALFYKNAKVEPNSVTRTRNWMMPARDPCPPHVTALIVGMWSVCCLAVVLDPRSVLRPDLTQERGRG